jgi:ABC-2 type transport system permease protein
MTTGTARIPAGHYRARNVLRSEWTKLRSVRSLRWTFAALVAGTLALGITDSLVEASQWARFPAASRAAFDPTNISLAGLAFAPLAIGIAGVLVMSGEYTSGTIRCTFAAVPRRRLVLAAKAVVLGIVALVVAELTMFTAFLAGQAVLAGRAPHATLGEPGVLRAVALSGAYVALLGLGGFILSRRDA